MRAATEAMFTIFPREAVSSGSCVNICVIAHLQQSQTPFAFTAIGNSEPQFGSDSGELFDPE
jgi:hypothetical protein